MKTLKIALMILMSGCSTAPEKITFLCDGHLEFYDNFPPSRGTGTNFVFFHHTTPNQNQDAIRETWIDSEGFPEEQYNCIRTWETSQEAIDAANQKHLAYETNNDPNKAQDEIDCK